jgi:transcriptional regulator GlxA family with amidase domain
VHRIGVLAFDGLVAADLAGPCEIFGRARMADGSPAYEVRVCAEKAEVDAGVFTLRAPWGLDGLADADTLIVPGSADPTAEPSAPVLDAVHAAAARGTRIASICTGAFVLAATGLLDGKRATTHWRAAAELARRHPSIDVDPDVLFVDAGQFLTSAGAAAGLDLCLHMIRADFGAAVAADSARNAVMPLERDGGQAQFIAHQPPAPDGATLEPLLTWMQTNLDQDITLGDLATRASTTTRTLNRRFREQTGTTPAQWLIRARLHRAQYLLETTDHPVERVAREAGFGSTATFRDRFRRRFGTNPRAYRRSFRSPVAGT